MSGCATGFDAVCMGWLPDASAAAGLTSVNGDTGPAVLLDAIDIPSTGPSDVQTDLDLLAATVTGLVIIDSAATLEAKFPNVAGVHTINQQTLWVSQTGAPISLLPGRSINVVDPGTIFALGGAKVLIIGDVAGPLVFGELVLTSVAILNTNVAGSDVLVESLLGRLVSMQATVLLGMNAGVVKNCTGVALFGLSLAPPAPGAVGLLIDGTNTSMLWEAAVVPPGTVPYTAWTFAATCTITLTVRFSNTVVFGTPAGDTMISASLLASFPTSPVPTNTVGFEVFGCALKGGATLFDPAGFTASDIEILSSQNTGAQTSQFIGDAIADTTVTAVPSPIVQTYVASNAWEVVPSDNAPTVAPNDVVLTLNTPLSQRHSVQIASRQVWFLQYDGPEDSRNAIVSYKATADRSGGSAATVDVQLEYDNGGGWTELPDTRDTVVLLAGTPQEVRGSTVVPDTNNGFALRLMSRTSNNGTNTDWHRIEISKGI